MLSEKRIVFYSWQSDLPNSCNRGFIHDALERAAQAIRADDTVAVEPVVDRDTQGVPGAPDIASTIFSKITAADVFVADVSIIGRDKSRATPNPNVLIELGYALKALGHERVILVFNLAFGKIEELPFDLRMRRVLVYEMAESSPKAEERKRLERTLNEAIRIAVEHPANPDVVLPPIPAVAAIEGEQRNRITVLRRNLEKLLKQLDDLRPTLPRDGGTADELMSAISKTQEPVAEFSKIAEMIAVMNDEDAALELYHWFGRLYQRYDLPASFGGGTFSNADFDYFKFLGHELFVTFVAFLLREERWVLLETVLREPIPVPYMRNTGGAGTTTWDELSEYLALIHDESHRRQRLSLHSDILTERHTTGGLASIMPFDDFTAADYFLFLVGELTPDKAPDGFMAWRPWSTLHMKAAPMFLVRAEGKRVAEQLLKLFGISDPQEFKRRFNERATRLDLLFRGGFWTSPLRHLSRFGE